MTSATPPWTLVVTRGVLAYLAAGLLFAVPFVARWAGRLDPAARSGSLGFRLLILPGSALLWPWLLARVLRTR
ncbi:MAG TPA: hypothetical protein VL241_09700 [Gemmatimonadales bacterium]|nr:hypothetical protein [Gemmatimonadales bacterium]